MSLVAGLDELGGDANAFPLAAHAAFQADTSRRVPSQFGQHFVSTLVLNRRGSGNYTEALWVETPELRDHLFGHAIDEEVFLRVVTQVQEG